MWVHSDLRAVLHLELELVDFLDSGVRVFNLSGSECLCLVRVHTKYDIPCTDSV